MIRSRGRSAERRGRDDLALAAPRRARQRRCLAAGMPGGPGVYVMRDRLGQALYVGKAGDLRTRVRSYFGSRRQPPRIEGALAALAAIDAAPTGSELEAAVTELDLIRRWRPPGNVRDARPDRAVYLRLALAEHAPALGLRTAVLDDGAVARRFPSRRMATGRPRVCATATGCARAGRACRGRRPVPARLAGRCLAQCRGGDDARLRRLGALLAAWLAGERGVVDAPLRAHIERRVSQQRFEDARRTTHCSTPCAADARVSTIRRARAAVGRAWPRISIRAASPSRSCEGPSSPSAGCRDRATRGSSSAPSPPPSSVRSTRLRRSSRAPRAPGCRRSGIPRRSCSRGPSPGEHKGSCPSPAPHRMRSRSGASRLLADGARATLPPGRHLRADELAAVA